MREDAALSTLKERLAVPPDSSPTTDGFLLRFLRATNLDTDSCIDKLRNRRKFERTFLALSTSPYLVRALRSGAFAVVGNDILGRPVLYLRMQSHYPSEDPLENEKLALVLLEYMASLAFLNGVSEVTILVNEENAGWFAHHNSLLQEVVSALVSNYYPELVALVLVADAAWSVARGVKSSTAARAKGKIVVVSKTDLQRYIDSSVVPQDLGGRNKVAVAIQEFSEQVMRYWYTVTNCIQAEREGAARPLWQQLPAVTTLTPQQQFDRRQLAARGTRSGPTRRSIIRSNASVTGSTAVTGNVESVDDGVCSVISDDFGVDIDDDLGDEDDAPPAAAAGGGHGSSSGGGGVVSRDLAGQLETERRQRMKLEQELAKMRLGVVLDDATLTPLEARLRQIHEEVNVLVAEAVQKARTHAAPGEPTLGALLEITDASILHEIQERQHVPAMHFAQPSERKPKSSCAIC